MFRRNRPAPAPAPWPLTDDDVAAIGGLVAEAAIAGYRLHRARGRLIVSGAGVASALVELAELGYVAERVTEVSIAVTGWRPDPATATVQGIDARMAELAQLRADALETGRITA